MTSEPIRIQRKRTKGWRMPPNTVYVGRGSRWGNTFVVGRDGTAAECVRKFADSLFPYRHHGPASTLLHLFISESNLDDLKELRGKNLACWCPLTHLDGSPHPCHADVLLDLANAA